MRLPILEGESVITGISKCHHHRKQVNKHIYIEQMYKVIHKLCKTSNRVTRGLYRNFILFAPTNLHFLIQACKIKTISLQCNLHPL